MKTLIVLIAVCTSALPGQKLRRAVAAADLVAIATSVRVIPAKTHVVHRLKIVEILRGPATLADAKHVAVIVTKRVAQHNKPLPARPMLFCLHADDRLARAAKLPASLGPYYKMSGYPGSAVVLDKDPDKDPRLALTRILIASQKGQAPRKTAEQLFAIALRGDRRVRIEATKSLSESSIRIGNLTDLHMSDLLTKAAGEIEDIPYKIALSEACAERKLHALVPTLCVSVEHVGDVTFLRALGRLARYVHKEEAGRVLLPHLLRAKGKTRDRLILALGATSTESALKTLLQMHRRGESKAAVERALRAHGSPRAKAAIAKKVERRAGSEKKDK